MRPFAYALLAAAAVALSACGGGGEVPKISDQDMTEGAANAPVEVIEYASTSCSHCAAWGNDVYPQFKAKYIDTGQARYTVREILTPPQAFAAAGFLLARCAGEDRYFNVLEAVFRAQEPMFATGDMRTP